MSDYTAISFAPVQGFIEKSRKLRDLFGASLILSHLSCELVKAAKAANLTVISPGLLNVSEGMPNRILVKGKWERQAVEKVLLQAWQQILEVCRSWLETEALPKQTFCWEQEWMRWGQYTWELFWGHGIDPTEAMRDLERRKLRRDWTGINWMGESSSLTGTDAIAWNRLGEEHSEPGRSLTEAEKRELKTFYQHLAWILDDPYQRAGQPLPASEQLQKTDDFGKYIDANERLSIPELAKRLVTFPKLAKRIGMPELEEGFKEVNREKGCWTGWFMGDGDKVGDALKALKTDDERQQFSVAMREWGDKFKEDFPKNFPKNLGRVVYAGGDDFLGVTYNSTRTSTNETRASAELAKNTLAWLKELPQEWQTHGQDITLSVGFVWAGHAVPQRDVLQHCREAEKRSKSLGRDRLTIRVVFNSGQYVQWTCPWDCLYILERYQDREGGKNWAHLYSDWAYLKARHTVRLKESEHTRIESNVATAMLNLYFGQIEAEIHKKKDKNEKIIGWNYVAGGDSDREIVAWIDNLVQVGWQLCSNT